MVKIEKSNLRRSFRSSADFKCVSVSQIKDRNYEAYIRLWTFQFQTSLGSQWLADFFVLASAISTSFEIFLCWQKKVIWNQTADRLRRRAFNIYFSTSVFELPVSPIMIRIEYQPTKGRAKAERALQSNGSSICMINTQPINTILGWGGGGLLKKKVYL